MSRYIDADAMKEWIDEYVSVFKKYDKSEVKGFVDHAPTIEPKRGKWIAYEGMQPPEFHGKHYCSNCYHAINLVLNGGVYNFCPNCGAKMKGADDE